MVCLPRVASLALISALACAPSAAQAEEGEIALSLGGGAWIGSLTVGDTEVLSVAPELHAAMRLGLDDFWQVGGSIAGGVALSADHDPAALAQAHVEAYYFLDITRWVVWGVAGVGALVRQAHADALGPGAEAAPRADLSVILGAGVDLRPTRQWSVGLSVRYQFVATDFARTAPTVDLAFVWTTYLEDL